MSICRCALLEWKILVFQKFHFKGLLTFHFSLLSFSFTYQEIAWCLAISL